MSDAAEEALAHCHITSLLSRYYQALDVADWDVLEREVLAEAAVWEVVQHSSSGTVRDLAEGRDAVLAWFRTMMSGDVSMSQSGVRHFIGTSVIDVDGAVARSTSHLQCIDNSSLAVLASGVVEAQHLKTDRGWRISRYKVDERITDADMDAFKDALTIDFE